jgi:ADP-ribose pyrophosphatase
VRCANQTVDFSFVRKTPLEAPSQWPALPAFDFFPAAAKPRRRMIEPWPTLRSRPIGDFRIFRLRSDFKRSPRTGAEHDFFVIESVPWVNVIAVTPDQQLVLVEQYRHGSDTVELEIPGGVMDHGETDPVVTALRELREETGYSGEGGRVIGEVWANPAIMNNPCFTILVENCRLTHDTALDHCEDIATRLMPVAETPKLVREGHIKHSLVVAALYYFELHRRQ